MRAQVGVAAVVAVGLMALHGPATGEGSSRAEAAPTEDAATGDRSGATVRVLFEGAGDVLVDGKSIDRATAARGATVPEGRRRVELRVGGGVVDSRVVFLGRGQTQTVRFVARK